MNRSRQRRKERRRAEKEAFFARQGRQMSMPRTMAHHITVDAMQADMDRGPRRAKLWIWIGGMLFLITLVSLVAEWVSRSAT